MNMWPEIDMLRLGNDAIIWWHSKSPVIYYVTVVVMVTGGGGVHKLVKHIVICVHKCVPKIKTHPATHL